MPKPEILDPQGQAVAGALHRLGVAGVTEVRQGKHFELEVDDAVDDATLHRIAGSLLEDHRDRYRGQGPGEPGDRRLAGDAGMSTRHLLVGAAP